MAVVADGFTRASRSHLSIPAVLGSAALIWLLFVVGAYVGNPRDLLGPALRPSTIGLCAGVFVGTVALTLLFRRGPVWVRLVSVVLCAASFYAVTRTGRWLGLLALLDGVNDGLRASGIVAVVALAGAGLHVGSRMAHKQVTRAFMALVVVAPVAGVAVASGRVVPVVSVICLFVLAWCAGKAFLTRFCSRMPLPADEDFTAIAIGLAVLALLAFMMAALGLVNRHLVVGSWIVAAIVLRTGIAEAVRRIGRTGWRAPVAMTLAQFTGVAMLAGMLSVYLIGTLAPETGSDALGLRVAVPATFLREGAMVALPEILGSYGPLAAEMLYLVAMPHVGFSVARLIELGMAVTLFLGMLTLPAPGWGRRMLPLFALPFWGSTVVWWQFFAGFVDIVQLFFAVAAVLVVQQWLVAPRAHTRRWLLIGGLLAGTSASVKLNAGVVLIGLALVVAARSPCSLRETVRDQVVLAAGALIALGPWMLRAQFLTGNPLFPYVNAFFGSPLGAPGPPAAVWGTGLRWPDVLLVPWRAVFDPSSLVEVGGYHPVLLALLPIGALALMSRRRSLGVWWVVGTCALVFWLATDQNLRYAFIPVYCLLIPASVAVIRALAPSPALTYSAGWVLLLAGFVGFATATLRPEFWHGRQVSGPVLPTGVLFGHESPEDYLSVNVRTFRCASWLNRHYGDAARVWLLPWDRDHLYFDGRAVAMPHATRPVLAPLEPLLGWGVEPPEPPAIVDRLREAGVTHVGWSETRPPWNTVSPHERSGVTAPAFVEAFLELECADRGFHLYRIGASPRTTLLAFLPNVLRNSGFDLTGDADSLQGWELAGDARVRHHGGNALLQLGVAATVTQQAVVAERRVYQLSLSYRRARERSQASVQIRWLDGAGRLRMFWRENLEQEGTLRFHQLAPDGAVTVEVSVQGFGAEIDDVYLRPISR